MQNATAPDKVKTQESSDCYADHQILLGARKGMGVQARGGWRKRALRSICAGLPRMGKICISRRDSPGKSRMIDERYSFPVIRYVDLEKYKLENSSPNQVWRGSFQSCARGAWWECPHDPEGFLSQSFQSLQYFIDQMAVYVKSRTTPTGFYSLKFRAQNHSPRFTHAASSPK